MGRPKFKLLNLLWNVQNRCKREKYFASLWMCPRFPRQIIYWRKKSQISPPESDSKRPKIHFRRAYQNLSWLWLRTQPAPNKCGRHRHWNQGRRQAQAFREAGGHQKLERFWNRSWPQHLQEDRPNFQWRHRPRLRVPAWMQVCLHCESRSIRGGGGRRAWRDGTEGETRKWKSAWPLAKFIRVWGKW